MSKFLIREEYYQMILEIIELERISVGHYLEHKYGEFKELNPHFAEILYKDIHTVLEGVLKEGDGDLVISDGDLAIGYNDFKLTGPINNLHIAEIGLHQFVFEKTIEGMNFSNEIFNPMERFECEYLAVDNNTPEYNKKLKELNGRIKGWQNPKPQLEKKNKTRTKIPKENKVRAELQKEIHSKCPLCDNQDVGHFEIHHIDEDPSNNEIINLLLICPICHSKITKNDITLEMVKSVKEQLEYKNAGGEFVSALIDSKQCSWECVNEPNIFFNSHSNNSPFPVISFTLINHVGKTLVLKTIKLKVNRLESGISGIPRAAVLKSLVKYKVSIDSGKNENVYHLAEPIQLPSNQAVKFDLELYEKMTDTENVIQGRMILFFVLEFSNNIAISVPKIYLNCKDENEGLKIFHLS